MSWIKGFILNEYDNNLSCNLKIKKKFKEINISILWTTEIIYIIKEI